MVAQDANFGIAGNDPVADSTRLPEYLYLYLRDKRYETPDDDPIHFLERIATVRWDTAQPKMMCLPSTADRHLPNMYCHVYEALFDTVYTIEGEYWLGGSANSNIYPYPTFVHQYFPTQYVGVSSTSASGRQLDPYAKYYTISHGADGPFYGWSYKQFYGLYGVIAEGQRYVEVSSADTVQGVALISAYYTDSAYHTISALPHRGYGFSHWNDSVTDNPRSIFVTSDTSFTAYFAPQQGYTVEVRSYDETLGYVEMGTYRDPTGQLIRNGEEGDVYYVYTRRSDSVYYGGETAKFRAVALEGHHFVSWNDGVTDNPRMVVVTQDTVFTAYFDTLPRYRLDTRCNNDVYGYVTGGGYYYEGETANIRAVPFARYYFLRWSDGPGFNPRPVVVTKDTVFTAIFQSREGPEDVQEAGTAGVQFRLVPNPASSEVRCETEGGDFRGGVLTMSDAAGREVLRKELAPQTRTTTIGVAELPAGTYFVTLATAEGSSVRKLVVE
jgi:hypothetical protein